MALSRVCRFIPSAPPATLDNADKKPVEPQVNAENVNDAVYNFDNPIIEIIYRIHLWSYKLGWFAIWEVNLRHFFDPTPL